MISLLLVDYGNVICLPQPRAHLERMAQLAGLDVGSLVERYWRHRPDYDRGQSAAGYWSEVSAPRRLDEERLGELVRCDLDSWSQLNRETLAVLEDARARGLALALLSNAPHELAELLDHHPALEHFAPRFFSCRLGAAKPDPVLYRTVLGQLTHPPREMLFVDDRAENVRAAEHVGLAAHQFSSPGELAARLGLSR